MHLSANLLFKKGVVHLASKRTTPMTHFEMCSLNAPLCGVVENIFRELRQDTAVQYKVLKFTQNVWTFQLKLNFWIKQYHDNGISEVSNKAKRRA